MRRPKPPPATLQNVSPSTLAPYVGANLDVMRHDATTQRGARLFTFTNFKRGDGVDKIANYICEAGGLG